MVADRSKIDHDRLRFEFVDMLFALAIAEVATHVSELLSKGGTLFAAPSAWFDLGLAFLLIVMSWIGWSNSAGMQSVPAATDVFSWPFVVLLIDVALVVVYYILVKGVEMPGQRGGHCLGFRRKRSAVRCGHLFSLRPVGFHYEGDFGQRFGESPRQRPRMVFECASAILAAWTGLARLFRSGIRNSAPLREWSSGQWDC
ncbi:MAG TPA: hypothetical protein VGN42_25730 [Pirellulales bacterium]|jgi:hypothetical protein|nr:hypothetical protein [Pirellulales bacterium]